MDNTLTLASYLMRVQAPKYKSGCLPVSERPAVLSTNCPIQKREFHIPTGRNGQLSRNGTPIRCLQFYFIPLLLSPSSSKPLEVDPRGQLAFNLSIFLSCNRRYQPSPVLRHYYPL
ncbi:hypothetical protein CDAR_408711 [Caerostris darwini]|uniref:Uncharacterized protein n=1 Tax=Caerostris darwini TaxID=1538125 RepID=A0AAV4MHU1_9ARAC|nr:hypothetical protein CDAR_408711 [Caerostris darwini]